MGSFNVVPTARYTNDQYNTILMREDKHTHKHIQATTATVHQELN